MRIDTNYVREAARAVDLEVASEHLEAVVAVLQRMEPIVTSVLEAPLTAADEAAPVWRL